MFLADLLFALAVGLVFALLFSRGLGRYGPWSSLLIFIILVFLAAWAGGLWVRPIGPPLFGVYWLPFVLVGLLFAVFLAAATPVPGRTQTTAARQEAASIIAFDWFFWLTVVVLVAAIVVGYLV